jgi:phosphomevalonate kinase
MQYRFSAPGKLFLAGEYAVLWGGRALVAAVGPRAGATVEALDIDELRIDTTNDRLTGARRDGAVCWSRPVPAAFRFAAATLEESVRRGFEGGVAIRFEQSPLTPSGQKLGMGSSARTAVLCAHAARALAATPFDAFGVALVAHANAQDQRGSGADVAAIHSGGLIGFRRGARVDAPGASGVRAPVECRPVALPDFHFGYAFSGTSASTTLLVAEAEQRLGVDERNDFVRASDRYVRAFEEGLMRADFEVAAGAVQALQHNLRRIGALETDEIRHILRIAHQYGCTAKTSGAGGGDGCVLMSPCRIVLDRLIRTLNSKGYFSMSLSTESGVRREVSP